MSDIVKRIVMAKRVASQWVKKEAHAEYRMRIYYGAKEIKNLPNLLRSFRDTRVAIQGLVPLPDMGIKESFDFVEVWSKNRKGLMGLQKWVEARDLETTGIW